MAFIKSYKSSLSVFSILLLFASCTSTNTLKNNFPATGVKKVNYLAPYCNINIFIDSSQTYVFDTSTYTGAQNIANVLSSRRSAYHLDEKIYIDDPALRSNFYADALELAKDISAENKIKNQTITKNISSVLNSQNENYLALLIYNRNLPSKKQVREKTESIIAGSVFATVVGVATGGMFVPIVNPVSSGPPLVQGGFYLLIFDKENQRPCYYKKVPFSKNDYQDTKILKDKIDTLFDMFLTQQS